MKIFATRKADQNRSVIDPWTIVHFATGLAFGLVNAPLRWTLPLATAYEVLEQYLERSDAGKEFFETSGPEVLPNAMVDVVVFAAGHELGRWWNRRV
ncbi:MAG TPA: hypothetical protein VFQ22_02955 [Longimicrobiales bacterium]|nr:hypothetical protein [Longimicrobiales bacterium]